MADIFPDIAFLTPLLGEVDRVIFSFGDTGTGASSTIWLPTLSCELVVYLVKRTIRPGVSSFP
jgi:hypothetical protein